MNPNQTSRIGLAAMVAAAGIMPDHASQPPVAVPLPADSPNPAFDREAEMRKLALREQMNQAAGAMLYAMERNPYPDTRQGRRRWARELAKMTARTGRSRPHGRA